MLQRATRRLRDQLRHRRLPWYLAALAMLLCAPSLQIGWQTDDYIHRAALIDGPEFQELSRSPAELFAFVKSDEGGNRRAMAKGLLPWWSHEALRIAFFRPLTGFTHWIDYKIWPQFPWLMHLHSLVWFGGVIVAATFFYRRMLGSTWIGGMAALLFAVDDAHGLPAAWLANRSATVGVFFGLLALLAHDHWRRGGWRMGAVIAPLALLLGLLSNEGAVATNAYLMAYVIFLDRDTLAGRLRSLVPCVSVSILWWMVYTMMGYGAAGSGIYIDPGASPLRFLGAVMERAPILFLGQWGLPADLQLVMSQRAGHATWLIALGFFVVMAAALVPLVRRDPLARFWAAGMMLALVPACPAFPSDRLLFFVGIGGMGLLAQFIAAVLQGGRWLQTRAWWYLPVRALCVVLIFVHLAVAPVALTRAAKNVKILGGVLARAAASLPSDIAVHSQTVLIVNTPAYFVSAYSPLIQALHGKSFPARMFVLGSSIHTIEIHRQDRRTLLIRPAGGFLASPGNPHPGSEGDLPLFDMRYGLALLDHLFRDNRPMMVGQQIELMGLSAEITAVTKDGRPAEAAFRFATALEDPSLRWMRYEDGTYVPFLLPAVGETMTLPAVTVPF